MAFDHGVRLTRARGDDAAVEIHHHDERRHDAVRREVAVREAERDVAAALRVGRQLPAHAEGAGALLDRAGEQPVAQMHLESRRCEL